MREMKKRLTIILGSLVASIQVGASTFMPPAATRTANDVNGLYGFLVISSLISFILLIGGLAYFVIKYKRQSSADKTAYITHNHALEFAWSFIPFCIFMFVFAWGWRIYHDDRNAPENALEVHVFAKKWDWRFLYKSGREVTSDLDAQGQKMPATLVVPVGRPVKLIMASEKISAGGDDPADRPVIHSFFLPAARIKQDVVPGRFTTIWFQLDEPGDFWVFCTEYCGSGHSAMKALVRAVPNEEFEKWLSTDSGGEMSLADRGKALYNSKACAGCHSANGTRVVGPTFKALWGSKHEVEGGASVAVNEEYVRESILEPNAKVAKGYPAGVMPTFAGQLKDEDINAIIEFLKTLK